jgi:hypothetical protein
MFWLIQTIIKLNVMFTLEQATKAQMGVQVWLCSFLNLGARWKWVRKACSGRFTPRKDPVPIV